MTPTVDVYYGDAWDLADDLEASSVDCIVTSPPYWGLRDYGHPGQFGLERTPQEYVAKLVELFARLRPALKDEGTLWLNLGDSYATDQKGSGGPSDKQLSNAGSFYSASQRWNHGLKQKDLVGIPWRVAFALQEDGWYLRSDIIWAKPNPMPESVTDRPTKAHEYIFLLTKKRKYFYDVEAIREPAKPWNAGRMSAPKMGKHRPIDPYGQQTKKVYDVIKGANRRTVWTIATQPYPGAHFATMPPDLAERCIKAGCPEGGTVLDPFLGSGTTAEVARKLGRNCIGFELNEDYRPLIEKRLAQEVLL